MPLFAGCALDSRGRSNAGDGFVAVLVLLWRPRQVMFVLLGTGERWWSDGIWAALGPGHSTHHNYIFYWRPGRETQGFQTRV